MSAAYTTVGLERREAVDLSFEEFINRYAMPRQPVIIRGAMERWNAYSRWTTEFFRSRCGSAMVPVYQGRQCSSMPLERFIDYMNGAIASPLPLYVRDWGFGKEYPELLSDYVVPEYFAEHWLDRLPADVRPEWRWLFLGTPGSGTFLHVDVLMSSAWNALLSGRKRWFFVSPEQGQLVYGGQVDFTNADLGRFPLLADAVVMECVQEPGEIVFAPSGWWHQVMNETPTIAITHNFVNATNRTAVADALRTVDNARLVRLIHRHVPELGL